MALGRSAVQVDDRCVNVPARVRGGPSRSELHGRGQAGPAVLTVTVNPAVDVSIVVEHLVPDQKLRGSDGRREAGGGGVNVSRVLRRLSVPTRTFVVVGGAIGAELVSLIGDAGLDVGEFTIAHPTRAVRRDHRGQHESAVPHLRAGSDDRPPGGAAAASRRAGRGRSDRGAFGEPDAGASDRLLRTGHRRTRSGHVHDRRLARTGPGCGGRSQGRADQALAARTRRARGWEPRTASDVERAATEVLERGAVNAVLASRGPAGALLVSRDDAPVWFRAPPVRPVSTVGAGDSMVAGIAAELSAGRSLVEAVRFGVAAGSAAVLTPGSALCEPAAIAELLDQVALTPVEPAGRRVPG